MNSPKYTIRIIEANTDSLGKFQITPLNDEGYNVMQPAQYDYQDQYRAITEFQPDPLDNTTNQNHAFLQLMGYWGQSLDVVHNCAHSRLFGTKTFVAKDDSLVPVANELIKVMVVVWH